MSATETIIAFAVKAALDKAVGGPMPVITGYHKTHFVLLAKALQESSRDQDIQKTLASLVTNLADVKDVGQRLIKAIPQKPVPPSADVPDLLDPAKNKQYSKQVAAFGQGVSNVLALLADYVKSADDLLKRTNGELAKVEKNLNMKDASWPAMRQISNAKRLEEIQFIKLKELDALSKTVGAARSLFKAYDQID